MLTGTSLRRASRADVSSSPSRRSSASRLESVQVGLLGIRWRPVDARAAPAICSPQLPGSRRNPVDALEHRRRTRHVVQAQIGGQRLVVDLASDPRERDENFHFRPERHTPCILRVEQRLLAESIAGHEQFASAAIGEREREHAPQPRRQTRCPMRGNRAAALRYRTASGNGGQARSVPRAARCSCRFRR